MAGVAAVAGGIVSGILPSFGGPDPEKQRIRLARIAGWEAAAITGDAAALRNLEGIAAGREGFGVAINSETVGAAQASLARVRAAGAGSPPSPGLAGVFGGNGKQPAWVMPFLLLSAGFAVYWYGIRKAA